MPPRPFKNIFENSAGALVLATPLGDPNVVQEAFFRGEISISEFLTKFEGGWEAVDTLLRNFMQSF